MLLPSRNAYAVAPKDLGQAAVADIVTFSTVFQKSFKFFRSHISPIKKGSI
jgi:hypothetical protein